MVITWKATAYLLVRCALAGVVLSTMNVVNNNMEKKPLVKAFAMPIHFACYCLLFFILAPTFFQDLDPDGSLGVFMAVGFLTIALLYSIIVVAEIIRDTDELDIPKSIFQVVCVALSGVVLFSFIYTVIHRQFPGSFSGTISDSLVSQVIAFLYFSIVTFTTVGFGDIVPVSNLARLAVIAQTLFGFIIIAVVISCFGSFLRGRGDS